MFRVRDEQLRTFDTQLNDRFVDDLLADLTPKLSQQMRVDRNRLRSSIVGWISDARKLGLRSDDAITRFVEKYAIRQAYREQIQVRLVSYLLLYHEPLAKGLNVKAHAAEVTELAAKTGITQDEGIAWLATILLYRPGHQDAGWVTRVLSRSDLPEEVRVAQVHQEAVKRGWIR